MKNEKEILNQNIDKTLSTRTGTYRKPRGILDYEWNFIWPLTPSFGGSIYHSLLKGFASVFEYDGLPEDIRINEFEMFLQQAGRMKIIKVGSKFYPVHITPKKYNHYGDYVESTIIEPYLPGLTGKTTEKFKNVEFKNDVLGQSLIRLVYPYIRTIDEAMENLDSNQKILAGKYIFLQDEVAKNGDNKEDEDSLSQWMINGKPVKLLDKTMLDDGKLPIHKLEIDDATQSFIDTVKFNISQMLNALGIPNNNEEGKKERLIVSEIAIQNILQSSILEDMLNMRERAVEEMNKIFGLNATVIIRSELEFKEGSVEEPNNEVEDENI